MEKGKGKWDNNTLYVHIRVATYLLKKEARQVNSNLKRGWPTCIKTKGDKIGKAWS